MEFASNGKGNLGVTLGAIGTGLSALNSNGMLGGLFNGGQSPTYVTKDVFDLQMQLVDSNKKNAILEADLNTETKIVDAFKASIQRENGIRDELKQQIREVEAKVDANAASQGVINAQIGSQVNLNTSQIGQLFSLTKFVIPNTNVCPGWGQVQIQPMTCGNTGTTIA